MTAVPDELRAALLNGTGYPPGPPAGLCPGGNWLEVFYDGDGALNFCHRYNLDRSAPADVLRINRVRELFIRAFDADGGL